MLILGKIFQSVKVLCREDSDLYTVHRTTLYKRGDVRIRELPVTPHCGGGVIIGTGGVKDRVGGGDYV